MKKLLLLLLLAASTAFTSFGQTTLTVNSGTGAIVAPVSATTFKSANSIQPLDSDLTTWAGITPGVGWSTILAATKPTTLSGYGITDAQPIDADLTSWAAITRASGFDTFSAAATSANFKALISDENAPDGASSKVLMALGSISIPSGQTLTVTTGGTLGTAAYTAVGDYTPAGAIEATTNILAGDGNGGAVTAGDIVFNYGTDTTDFIPYRDADAHVWDKIVVGTGLNFTTGTLSATDVSDTAYGSSWNAVTTISGSKNSVYDWGHTFDTDDDGKVNVLDMGAGLVKTDSGGVASAATAGVDYSVPTTTPQKKLGTVASSATPSIDSDAYDVYTITAQAAAMTSLTITGSPTEGKSLLLQIKDDGTNRALAFGTGSCAFSDDLAAPTTTATGKWGEYTFIYRVSLTKWVLTGKLENVH